MNDSQPKNFSFIRVHPIKKWGKGDKTKSRKTWGLTGNIEHDLRFIFAPNADPELISSNQIICAKTDWKPLSATKENLKKLGMGKSNFLEEMARALIAEKGVVVQKNHVKAAMLMAAVSPEYLRDGNLENDPNPDKARKLVKGTTAYLRKKYGDRLLMLVYHGDEQNPHLSAYVLPLIEKTVTKTGRPPKGMENQPRETHLEWRLSFADFFRRDKRILEFDPESEKLKFVGYERGLCTVLQDEYAEALRAHGLDVQRGIRKSDEERALQYEPTKLRYERLRTPPTEIEGMNFDELREWAERAIPQLTELKRARKERDHYQKASGHHQQRVEKLEKDLSEIQREIPVEEVIKKLTGLDPQEAGFSDIFGPEPTKKHKNLELEFLLPNGQRIGITTNNGFENLTPGIGFPNPHAKRTKGRGAISAVKYLTGWEHAEATQWLADHFGDGAASQEIARTFREEISVDRDEPTRIRRKDRAVETILDLQTPDDSRWPAAGKMLTETLRFGGELIEELRRDNRISANKYGQFVFEKQLISGTEFKPAGQFVIHPDHPSVNLCDKGEGLTILPGKNENLIVCATPMDALAVKSSPAHRKDTVVVIGNNPTESTAASLDHLIKNSRGVKALAENLTMIGQRLAVWLNLHFSTLGKLPLPHGCTHWLEVHRLEAEKNAPAEPAPTPSKSVPKTPDLGDSPN